MIKFAYPLELLDPFKKLTKAAILQYRVTMDTANIATQHRMAYLAFITQLDSISKAMDAMVPAVGDTTFEIEMSPLLILSALAAVTIQNYINCDISNLNDQSVATTLYQTDMSKITTAAIQTDVDVNWYTTWGKTR